MDLKLIENFENKTPSKIEYDYIDLACGKKMKVYTIESVHDLTQFIGYGKYINSKGHNVFLRGQTSLYKGSLIPSLYRNRTKIETINVNYNTRINKLKREEKSFSQYDKIILEPLLQHYGIKSPYIDVVDNIWVALWFALHQAESKAINSHEYIYYHESNETYAYILLIASDAISVSETKGVYSGEKTNLIDLRKALPSYFLRPHAQHAFMINKSERLNSDYSDLIIGIARIPINLGFKWLGTNSFLNVSSLFPAAYFDDGYAVLLKKFPEDNQSNINQYGSIQIITD